MSSVLIDSNVFVYAYDPADRDKHERALQLIERVTQEEDLVLSAQILNELTWTLLRRGSDLTSSAGSSRPRGRAALPARHRPAGSPDLLFISNERLTVLKEKNVQVAPD